MFFTYIIYSASKDRFYVGATENIAQRLKKHNNKNKGFTNQANDWKVVFIKEFETKQLALGYEKQIKSWKSKVKIKQLISEANTE